MFYLGGGGGGVEHFSPSADIIKPQIWLFYSVVLLTTATKWTKTKNAHAGRAKHKHKKRKICFSCACVYAYFTPVPTRFFSCLCFCLCLSRKWELGLKEKSQLLIRLYLIGRDLGMRTSCLHWLERLPQATQSIRALALASILSLFSEMLTPRIRISPFTVKTKNFGRLML